jgi:hypothetical protein
MLQADKSHAAVFSTAKAEDGRATVCKVTGEPCRPSLLYIERVPLEGSLIPVDRV